MVLIRSDDFSQPCGEIFAFLCFFYSLNFTSDFDRIDRPEKTFPAPGLSDPSSPSATTHFLLTIFKGCRSFC